MVFWKIPRLGGRYNPRCRLGFFLDTVIWMSDMNINSNIAGGRGKCSKCGEMVNNVSLHETLCGIDAETCQLCKGTGKLHIGDMLLNNDKSTAVPCPACKGTGKG